MSASMLNRLAGAAAIVAGILRAIASFAFQFLDTRQTDLLFMIADIALLFALFGLYGRVWRAVGWAGLAGFAAAIVGVAIMRGAAGIIDTYFVGIVVLATGAAVMSAAMLGRRAFPPLAPALLIAGLAVGVLAYWRQSDWLFETGSVIFGAGFVVAGVELFRARPKEA